MELAGDDGSRFSRDAESSERSAGRAVTGRAPRP